MKSQKKISILRLILIFIVVSFVSIMWYGAYNHRRLPHFSCEAIGHFAVISNDLERGRLYILFLRKDNAFTDALIRRAYESRSGTGQKILIFTPYFPLDLLCDDKERSIYFIKDFDATSIQHLFGLDNVDKGWALEYDNGVLKAKRHLTKTMGLKIIATSSQSDPMVPTSPYIDRIMRASGNLESGVYFITEQLHWSCACYSAYESLRTWCLEHNSKLNLIVVGDLTDLDISNYRGETADTINVSMANNTMKEAVIDWGKSSGRVDFNLIILKKSSRSIAFPLINYADYDNWQAGKGNALSELEVDILR